VNVFDTSLKVMGLRRGQREKLYQVELWRMRWWEREGRRQKGTGAEGRKEGRIKFRGVGEVSVQSSTV